MNSYLIILFVIVVIIIGMVVSIKLLQSKKIDVWYADLKSLTENNDKWRDVVFTGDNVQIATMSVPPGEELGMEVHPHNEQFFYITSGRGLLEIKGQTPRPLVYGVASVVPKNTEHNVKNTGETTLKLFTTYSPPHHPPNTIHITKYESH